MNSNIGAITLVSGTIIGSGIISLPMSLAGLGLIPMLILMFLVWLLIYYAGLANQELIIKSGRIVDIGDLGKEYQGKITGYIGKICLLLLSYSLISAYISGTSTILGHFLEYLGYYNYNLVKINIIVSIFFITIFSANIKSIDKINRLLFTILAGIILLLLLILSHSLKWDNIPLWPQCNNLFHNIIYAMPVLIASFGFQGSAHAISKYCRLDPVKIKTAYFYGTLFPTILYIVWTTIIVNAIYQYDINFYYALVHENKDDLPRLLMILSNIAQTRTMQVIIWMISLFAILTSAIGVGLGLMETLKAKFLPYIFILFEKQQHYITNDATKNTIPAFFLRIIFYIHTGYYVKKQKLVNFQKLRSDNPNLLPDNFPPIYRQLILAIMIVLPACLISILLPQAFIKILSFAGLILVIIAIIIPMTLLILNSVKFDNCHYKILNYKYLRYLTLFCGGLIIICEKLRT